jgi:hypothetical protein
VIKPPDVMAKRGKIMIGAWLCALLELAPAVADDAARELAPPIRIQAAGKPIDVEIGHAAPFVCDFDGDKVNDLLVGQFGDGILWIFRNEGTNAQPKLAAGVKFKDGNEDGRVPTG